MQMRWFACFCNFLERAYQDLSFGTLFMKIEWVVLSTEPMKVLFINIKILSNFPLWAAITQLAHNCRDVNVGFQKLETITFDLMYVDKCFSE